MTWVFAPACSATAVRDPLVLTGKPWNSPAARFAAPIPIISFCPSISSPLRAANDDAVEMVSVSDTRAIPSAPPTSNPMSDSAMSGTVRGGNPWGSTPTTSTPWPARSKASAASTEATTATRTPGAFGSQRCRLTITTSPNTPMARAAPTVSPSASPVTKPVSSSRKPSPSTENPKSFGSWPTRIVSASPFM